MEKSADAFRTISEVADDLTLPQHVLRFWETRFPQIRPMKRAGGRRYYRPSDIVLLKTIRQLLYDDGYTIKGVQRLLKEQGPRALVELVPPEPRFAEGSRQDEALSPMEEALPMLPDPTTDEDEPHVEYDHVALAPGEVYRDALIDTIATIDECLHLLSAARRNA